MGPTLITTTFMLLGEPVVAFKDGERFELEPLSQGTDVDFGPGRHKPCSNSSTQLCIANGTNTILTSGLLLEIIELNVCSGIIDYWNL